MRYPGDVGASITPQKKQPAFPFLYMFIFGFPKIRGYHFGAHINEDYSILGLYWGPLILGNYHRYISYIYMYMYIDTDRQASDKEPFGGEIEVEPGRDTST